MKKITFKIKRDGTVSVEAFGFSGVSCIEETSKFTDALGIQESVTYKQEFFEVEHTGNEVNEEILS